MPVGAPPPISSTSREVVYETPKEGSIPGIGDDDDDNDDDDSVKEEAQTYGRENVGTVAIPYLMPYVYRRCFLYTQYGIRKEGGLFMIGDTPVVIDTNGNITIKGTVFRRTEVLWEQLMRKNVNTEIMNKDDQRT